MHSALVDPQELSVPSSIFDALCAGHNFAKAPHLEIAIVMTMWAPECVLVRQRPIPDQANLLSTGEIQSLAKNATLVAAAEKWLVDARNTILPLLVQHLGMNVAKEVFLEFSSALIRLIFSKKLSHLKWVFPKGFTTGSCTQEKHKALLAGWLKNVDLVQR